MRGTGFSGGDSYGEGDGLRCGRLVAVMETVCCEGYWLQ